jgi:hypothetical protein
MAYQKSEYGTKKAEYRRTAEMLVDISADKGAYYALALVVDIGYTRDEMKDILLLLHDTRGSRKI